MYLVHYYRLKCDYLIYLNVVHWNQPRLYNCLDPLYLILCAAMPAMIVRWASTLVIIRGATILQQVYPRCHGRVLPLYCSFCLDSASGALCDYQALR